MITNDFTCPNCKDCDIWRESVDVGVGIIYGPYGCENCGWSESGEYNLATGTKTSADGSPVDQFGGVYPGWKALPTSGEFLDDLKLEDDIEWSCIFNDPNIQI